MAGPNLMTGVINKREIWIQRQMHMRRRHVKMEAEDRVTHL